IISSANKEHANLASTDKQHTSANSATSDTVSVARPTISSTSEGAAMLSSGNGDLSCSAVSCCSPMGLVDDNEDHSEDSSVEFASSEEEEETQTPPVRNNFKFAAAFCTIEEAKAGIDTLDDSIYKFAYNYGKKGKGQRVYKCVSHTNCNKRLRLSNEDGATSGAFIIEEAGHHGNDNSTAKARGIHGFFKREVRDLLLGSGPKKCRQILLDRYAQNPERLRELPTETQLKNYKTTLKASLTGKSLIR
ncbi:hypothetical protein BBJ28_00027038, partial [Nothophytophthora sp. Chile5]